MRSVSSSDIRAGADTGLAGLEQLAAELERCVDHLIADRGGSRLEVDEEPLRQLVSAAARLYARHAESAGAIDPLREDVSPTEAVELACGLLRARDLNPFDLALWFSRAR